jgi:hypothetical protein
MYVSLQVPSIARVPAIHQHRRRLRYQHLTKTSLSMTVIATPYYNRVYVVLFIMLHVLSPLILLLPWISFLQLVNSRTVAPEELAGRDQASATTATVRRASATFSTAPQCLAFRTVRSKAIRNLYLLNRKAASPNLNALYTAGSIGADCASIGIFPSTNNISSVAPPSLGSISNSGNAAAPGTSVFQTWLRICACVCMQGFI